MRPIPPGAFGRFEIVPDRGHTAAAIGNEGVAAVSTPSLIAFLEQASHLAIREAFEPNEASVGTRVDVEHVAPAYPGRRVSASATVTAVDRRSVRFDVLAEQDGRVVMRGRHNRFVIDLARFLGGRPHADPEPGAVPCVITFWFDFNSPWCYLASTRVGRLAARHGAVVHWRPLQLAQLIDAIGGRRVLEENPAFVRWYRRDLQDWAALQGATVRYHPDFPLRPSRALRVALLAEERGLGEAWVVRAMRAYWSEAADISDLSTLGRLATECCLDSEQAIEAAGSDAYKAMLEANTREAVDAGIFGVPSFVVDGTIHFGNDRLAMLDRQLGDRRSPFGTPPQPDASLP